MTQKSETNVLLCNGGSSSLKLAQVVAGDGRCVWQQGFEGDVETLCASLGLALDNMPSENLPMPQAVLHRIVHAGLVTETPGLLDAALLERIAHWAPLAPLHNHLALQLISIIAARWPQLPQYAIFDSGLYAHLPDVASHYALPADLSPRWPLRRYGFHGLAHRSQWRSVQRLSQKASRIAPRRLITLQLGSGCSVTTWRDDQAIDTTMGFTPLEGLVMSTRCGSIDPGIVLHLLRQEKLSVNELDSVLSRRSGLAALGAGNGDMRAVLALEPARASAALAHYAMQIRKSVGAAIAVLGGVDAISIGGGVGEHQPVVRQAIFAGLDELGIVLDPERNQHAERHTELHTNESVVALWLCQVDEMDEMWRQYKILGC
ncbi:MAG: acetate kinase [Gammaproteobacteria bacterium]|nr:acetate kinase [Gammaproteobacteria bacterium]